MISDSAALKLDENPLISPEKLKSQKVLINRAMDFWFLGGISFVAWIFAQAAFYFGNTNAAFDRQVMNWPFAFSALTLVCNHPHFISSYRIAYGNGLKKIKAHWFTLLAVPATLISLFIAAYLLNGKNFESISWLASWDARWPDSPLFGTLVHTSDFGSDLLRVGVWAMWLLVGWHYSKQAFGVMVKYASFDGYLLSHWQRRILKFCLLAVVPANVIGLTLQMRRHEGSFQDLSMPYIEIPEWTQPIAYWICTGLALAFVAGLGHNYFKTGKLPSINFLTPFVAFYLWWFPDFWPQPFAMVMIPFFHSLQYLPFAYRRIEGDLPAKTQRKFLSTLTVNIISILVVGFLFFDLVPAWLDSKMETKMIFGNSFFMIAIIVFLNVHHFFIDSAIWRGKKAS